PAVRLMTLTGPGGVGKTRLAVAAAEAVLDEFAGEVCFVPLASVRDVAFVLPTIARELGLRERGDRPVLEQLTAWLRGRRLLLVLDNLEHVAIAAPLLAALLGSCPDLKVLATSRVTLRVSGERVYPVPPFDLVETRALPPLEALSQVPAIALFVQRAGGLVPEFVLDETNAGTIAEIC